MGFESKTVSQDLLFCRFMKGACRLLPVSRPLVPPCDLAVVLEELKGPLFQPLQGEDLKHESLRTVLLLALVYAKLASDIHPLSLLHSVFFSERCDDDSEAQPSFCT